MVGHVVGFEQERFRDYWNALPQLLLYDPDRLNVMHATPHRWTPFYRENVDRPIVQNDRSKWDYRHQVLGTRYLKPWQIILLVKIMKFIVQMRPRALARLLACKDRAQRHQANTTTPASAPPARVQEIAEVSHQAAPRIGRPTERERAP